MAEETKPQSVEKLFPEEQKEAIKEEKELNYGHMFKLSADEKKKIVRDINDCVEECKKQRESMLDRKKKAIRNYEGIKETAGPWDGSSNISTMITTITSDMLHSKLFPMVWNPDLLHFTGREKHDERVAENNKTLMHWAITKDMEDSQDKADEITWRLIIEGMVIVKVQWETWFPYVTRAVPEAVDDKGTIVYGIKYDQIKRERAKWTTKDIDHIYFPVNAPNVREAEYIVEEAYFTLPMIEELKAKGLFLPDFDVSELKAGLAKLMEPEAIKDVRNMSMGLADYRERMESYPIKFYEAYKKHDINKDGIREECVFITVPDFEMYASGKPLHCVSKTGIRPYIIRPFLRRPGTMIGVGNPEIVYHLHNEMDAIHNQRIDAGNMVIAPPFFYRPASGFDPQKISVRPATGIPLDDPQRDVVFPDYNASRLSVSFQEEQIVMQLIQMLTNVTDPMLGKELANRPTARGTMAIIAQTDQRFTPLAGRVVKIMSDLITLTRKFYEENLDPSIAARVLGKDNKLAWTRYSPEMIAGDYDGYMNIDLSTTNEALEKQADQVLYQTMIRDEFVNQNPAYAWELRALYLRSLGKKDIEKIIGPKPDYELSPGDIEDENQLMYQEQIVEVKQADNDLAHINSHAEFKRRMGQFLTPQANVIISTHLISHKIQYESKMQQLAMQNQGGQGVNQGNAGIAGPLKPPGMGAIQGPDIRTGQPGAQVPQVPAGGQA